MTEEGNGYSYKTPESVGGGIPIVDPEYIDAVTAHVEAKIGKVDNLFHEIVSQHVHVDVLVIEASRERPWTTLVTCGMGCRRMAVPKKMKEFSRAELAICLPRNWPLLSAADGSGGPGGWIVPPLQWHARMPFEHNTWLGQGHTIPNGDPPAPIADGSSLCCVMLGKSRRLGKDFHKFTLPNGENVYFWNLWFLTEAEMNFKLRKGEEALLERLKAGKADEVLRLNRKSVCKKGFFGFFQ